MFQLLNSKNRYHWILALFIFPLAFININTFHNWGDDFAQYLCQARDIVNGATFNETPVLDKENIGPINRGSGFSLLLSPIYFFFKLSIAPYLVFISLCLIIVGFVLFKFYSNKPELKNRLFLSVLMVLIVVYNRHVLFLKTEILTVFPFMFLLYLVFILYENKTQTPILLISILIGFLISIANTGWVLYMAVFLFSLGTFIFNPLKQNFKNLCVQLSVPLFVYGCIKFIVFKTIFTDDIIWYQPLFSFNKIGSLILENAVYYKDIFLLNFDQDMWFALNKAIKLLMLLFAITGLFFKLFKNYGIYDLFFILYVLLLLIYPDKASGIRFLTPVTPLILYYSVVGSVFIFQFVNIKSEFIFHFFYAGILLSYFQNIQSTIQNYGNYSEGPYQQESIETFKYIKDSTNKNCRIAFFKPWTIKLYAERASMPILVRQNLQQIKSKMRQNRVEYLLLSFKKVPEEMYHKKAIVEVSTDRNFVCIWTNQYYGLYQLMN